MKNNYFKKEEQELFDAMWQWIIDHSDLQGGSLFLKAHVKSKQNFAKSIVFRMKGHYRSYWTDEIIEKKREEHLERSKMGSLLKQVEKENRKLLK